MTKAITKYHSTVLAMLAVLVMASTGWAADYYVDATGGNDTNPGTQSSPWQTLTKVNGFAFKAGDNVYFQSGDSWSAALKPVSGANGVYVTYGAYGSGAKPVIRNVSIDGKSYVKVQDLQFSSTTADSPVYINNSSYIWVQNCEIYAEVGATAWAALRLNMNAHHNKIINCTIERRDTATQGDAVNLTRNANNNLIEGNTIGKASHYALSLEGSNATYPTYECRNNVIRNNTIDNPYGAVVGMVSNSNRNLIENNVFMGGGTLDKAPHSLKVVSNYNIVRLNVVKNNPQSTGYGVSSIAYQYSSDPPNNVIGNRIYNNVITTIYKQPVVLDNYNPGVSVVNNNIYKNNVIFNNGTADNYQLLVASTTGVTDNYFFNNAFFKSGVTNLLKIKGTATSVAGVQSNDAAHYSGNIQLDPKLDSSFHVISGSPCIDAGDFLTKVTSSAGTGSVITVADAGYFSDGFGMSQGDSIRVGNTIATIKSVDYASNTITLTDVITWKSGDPVSLPFSGTKPDIGALESSTTLPSPANLRLVSPGP